MPSGNTTTTTAAPCDRPGNGFGDKNHVHCGPPGQGNDNSQGNENGQGGNGQGNGNKFGGKNIASQTPAEGLALGFVIVCAALGGLVLALRRRGARLS
jgi:hypothetical protein